MASLPCLLKRNKNENQALTLYERHGFETDRLATEWHKSLEVDDA